MNLNIREMLPKERDYAYTQSYQLMSQSGCIALMRGDFGNGGRTFYPDYEDQIKQYRTDEFAAEFDSVIKEFYKVGILADRGSMLEYCCARPDGRFMGNFSREYGYRVDTDKYTYLLRCIPAPGDNNFYCYAYVSDLLNSHMEKAAQGIRFIDSRYKELFRLPDGGNIIITHMFSDLCKYASEDFYREHKTIRFDTLSGFGEYEIIAVFKTAAYSEQGFKYYHFTRADSAGDFNAYVSKCKELSFYDTGVSAEYGDKLITLSTCEYSRQNGRMVVVAKQVIPPAVEVDGDEA